MALRFNRCFVLFFFFSDFRCLLCPTLNLSKNPPKPPLTPHTLAHPSSLFSCCFATICVVRCELSGEISADQRSYHPNQNFLAHWACPRWPTTVGPLPWARYRGPATVGLLRGFDLWNLPVARKGGPRIFSFPLRFLWEK